MKLCFYCGYHATTKDHIVPKSKGGKGLHNNTVPCCKLCNSTKSNLSQEEFIRFIEFSKTYASQLRKLSKNERKILKQQYFEKTGIKLGFTTQPPNTKHDYKSPIG